MALPIAHSALVYGMAGRRDYRSVAMLALLSVLPDFDFALVWFAGLPIETFHRSFSHSLLFAGLFAWGWSRLRPTRFSEVSGWLVFGALVSHGLLDMACTADAADHGVKLLWPLDQKLGWPILVPLYRMFGDSPHSWEGALRFSILECLLAPLLVFLGQGLSMVISTLESTLSIRAHWRRESATKARGPATH